jgi:hypothetical protein
VVASVKTKVELAWDYIELLILENSRLHKTIGRVDRFFGDVLANCSHEVYQANMDAMIADLEDLNGFIDRHKAKISKLAEALNEPTKPTL